MTPAQYRALSRAAARDSGYICPVRGVRGRAEDLLIESLRSSGWATRDVAPRITPAGLAALTADDFAAPPPARPTR